MKETLGFESPDENSQEAPVLSEEEIAKHSRMMEKLNQGFQKKQAKAVNEKGLLIVLTGPGKGKSSSAMGMALRGVAHGMKVGIVQFIKSPQDVAERRILEQFENLDWFTIGDGFTWITQNKAQDIATAKRGWAQAKQMIESQHYDILIFDELNIVLNYNYLPVEEVLIAFAARHPMQHIIVTGRNAPEALLEQADLVSDVRALKHPYKQQGVKAQKGIEF